MRNYATAGERHGRLTFIRLAEKRLGGHRWLARCDCGNEITASVTAMRSGNTHSCGCLRREVTAARARTHGLTETGEYRTWCHMLARCYTKTDQKYPRYGARGIRVCDSWRHSFEQFYADMGPRPTPSHSIERADNDGNYEPANCRWATAQEQAQNKSNNRYVVVGGRRVSSSEACRRLAVHPGALHQRVKKNGGGFQEAADHFAATSQRAAA